MSGDRFGTKYDRLYVAALTPMKEDYEVDEPALRKFLQYFMQPKFREAGVGIIINPEAGELHYLSREETRRNVEIAVEECGGKVPVFAGVIAPRTSDAVKIAIDAKDAGADGIFVMPPIGSMDITTSWNPDKYPEIFVDLAKAEVDAVDLPAIIHPTVAVSQTYGIGLPVAPSLTMCREIPNVVGWKMTYSYNGSKIIAKALRALDRHIALLCSGAAFYHENLATGYFDGTLSGTLNFGMERIVEHIAAWKRKDIDEARRIWNSGAEELFSYISIDYSRLHAKYKTSTWLRGLIPLPFLRPPMPRPKKEEIIKLYELLSKAGLTVIPRRDVDRLVQKYNL